MNLETFNTIKIGTTVFIVSNSGSTGVSEYQYIGIFKDHKTKELKHVFLSNYFVSTVCILKGKEMQSIRMQDIYLLETDANKAKLTYRY